MKAFSIRMALLSVFIPKEGGAGKTASLGERSDFPVRFFDVLRSSGRPCGHAPALDGRGGEAKEKAGPGNGERVQAQPHGKNRGASQHGHKKFANPTKVKFANCLGCNPWVGVTK